MINEPALRDALLALAEQSRTQYVMMSAVLNEVGALRETVRGLDPTFAEVLEEKRKNMEQSTREVVSLQVGLLGEIIQRLKDGEVC